MTNNEVIKIEQTIDELLVSNIRSLMHKHNVTEAELARRANVPQPTVHKILAGKTADPRISTLKAIADYFNISMDEIYTGISNPAYTQIKPETQSIPVLSWADCLKGIRFLDTLTPNNWEKWQVIDFPSRHAYALISKPSMEPRFPRDSVLIIDPDIKPADGDLVVVHYPNTQEATLREISIDGPVQLLSPLNTTLPNQGDPIDGVSIVGVLLQSRFQYR